MENTNLFDIITLSVIAFLALKGLFSGFIKEVFALFGIIGGVFIASRISSDFSSTTSLFIFVSVFAGFWMLCYFAGIAVAKVSSISGLGFVDKVLGFVFAGGKIFFIISIIMFSASNVDVIRTKLAPKMANSFMYPLFVYSGGAIMKIQANNLINKVDANASKAVDAVNNVVDVTSKLKEISK